MSEWPFAVGTRVQYRHGLGLATGTVIAVKGDRRVIETRNQHRIVRKVTSLTLAEESK